MSEAGILDNDAPVAVDNKVAVASQAQLTWWAFKRHKLAMAGLWVIGGSSLAGWSRA